MQPYPKQVTVSLPPVRRELAWCPDPGKLRKKLFFSSPWDCFSWTGVSPVWVPDTFLLWWSWVFSSSPVDPQDNTLARSKSVPKPVAVKAAHCFPGLWFYGGNEGLHLSCPLFCTLLWGILGGREQLRHFLWILINQEKTVLCTCSECENAVRSFLTFRETFFATE